MPSSFGVVDAGVLVTLIGEPAVGLLPLTHAYEPMPAPAPITAESDAATSTVAKPRFGRTAVAVTGRRPAAAAVRPAGAGKSAGAEARDPVDRHGRLGSAVRREGWRVQTPRQAAVGFGSCGWLMHRDWLAILCVTCGSG